MSGLRFHPLDHPNSRKEVLVSRFRASHKAAGASLFAVLLLVVVGVAYAAAPGPNGSSSGPNPPKFVRLSNGLLKYTLPKFYGPCTKTYTVYELQAHRADAWAQSTAQETNSFGKTHCLKIINQDAGGYANVSKQIAQLQAAIAAKPAAIILWTTDPTAVDNEVAKARAAGIKVIGFTAPPTGPTDATVSGNWQIDGGLMLNAIAKKIGGKGDVLAIWGGAGGSYQTGLAAGAKNALKSLPGIKLTTKTIAAFSPADVTPLVQNQLTIDPNLKGVILSIAGMADGAFPAINKAGDQNKVSVVSGLFDSAANVQDVRTGRISYLVGVPSVFYADMVDIVTANMLNGKPYPKLTTIPGQVFTPSNIKVPGALKWELRASFLK
jgi:ABC-type sugar transport system substrate-binding protein